MRYLTPALAFGAGSVAVLSALAAWLLGAGLYVLGAASP